MSNEKVTMTLEGYEGPYFPSILDALHAAYAHSREIKREEFEQMGAKIEGFLGVDDARTDDGRLLWYCRIIFKVGKHDRVAVLIPWRQDRSFKDGTPTDRHMAIYVQGGVSMQCMSSIAARLLCELEVIRPPSTSKRSWDDTTLH